MADQKLTALSEVSAPALTDISYLVADPGGTPVSDKITLARLLGLTGFVPGGRLTLTTGVPVTTSDVTGAGTLYYTPYLHDRIRIYDGTRWKFYAFTEKSLSLTLTSGKNYDVFIYDNSGTLTLELSAAWTNDTTRADALTTQDGVKVKSGATTRFWLGTIRASGANTTEDSGGGVTSQVGAKRFVWNQYNRIPRHIRVHDTTDSWTYATTNFRQANGASGNMVEYVCGAAEDIVDCALNATAVTGGAGNYCYLSIGIDSTSTPDLMRALIYKDVGVSASPRYNGVPGLGYHYLAWLEKAGSGTIQFNGDSGSTTADQSGMSGVLWS